MTTLEYLGKNGVSLFLPFPKPDPRLKEGKAQKALHCLQIARGVKSLTHEWMGEARLRIDVILVNPNLRDETISRLLHELYYAGLISGVVMSPNGKKLVPPHYDD